MRGLQIIAFCFTESLGYTGALGLLISDIERSLDTTYVVEWVDCTGTCSA